MSCCQNTTCIQVFIDDCSESVNTGLKATSYGIWVIMIEFNGTWQRLSQTLNPGDEIIIPNVFNSNYASTVQILQPDGTLFNNTCYTFDMCQIIDASSNATPSTQTTTLFYIIKTSSPAITGSGTLADPYQLPAGNTITLPQLLGCTLLFPVYMDTNVFQNINWDAITATWDNTVNGGFVNGNLITVNYEKPII